MTYILPVLYVIVSYTFFLLAVHFGNAITLQIVSILLPFIMGIVNLIVVLTVGRKWSRKTLLNCTLIIKYGLIPVLPDRREHHCICNADGILPIAADGVVRTGNHCIQKHCPKQA